MRSAVRRALLISVAVGFAGLLAPGPAAARTGTIAVPRGVVVLKPFALEIQINRDHWQKDIHIPERWGTELRIEERKSVHFGFKQRAGAPATVSYQVFIGRLPKTGEIARPVASGSLGKPPGLNNTREFDIDFTKFLPAQPNGRTYHVRLVGPADGGGITVCSNGVVVSYKQQDVTVFPSPSLTRVVGTADPYGKELKWDQKPLLMSAHIFRVEGTDLYEVPAETVVQFLKGSQVVKEVHPVAAQTQTLPSGEVSLGATTPSTLDPGLYMVRVKTSWGVTGQAPAYVSGREDADHQFVGYVSNEEDRFVGYVCGFRDEFKGTWSNPQYYWGEARFLGADHLTFADSADLAYIAGHGAPSYIKMSAGQGCWLPDTALGSHSTLDHTGDLEYIVFHSCSVLSLADVDGVPWRERWAHTYATRNDPRPFSGLHVAMGFRTTHHNGAGAGRWAADEFAENLEEGHSVRYSWYEAAEDARYLAGWTDNKPAVFYLRPHKYEKAGQHNSTDFKYGDADYLLDAYYMK